jgi:acetyl esterase/lipase
MRIEDRDYLQVDGCVLKARFYRPDGRVPFPAVVYVHGGGWVGGDRLADARTLEALAGAGILVMSVDFRMPPRFRYPCSLADVNYAIRWLKQHAAEFGTAPELVGGMGASSGGHQIVLSALKPRDPFHAALPLRDGQGLGADLAFVVACWPVLDPLARFRMAGERGLDNLVQAHRAYWPDEAAMAAGSPQAIVEAGAAQASPPLLIVQGTDDGNLTPDMADRFAAAYRAAGAEVELAKFEGAPHGFITKDFDAPASRTALAGIVAFIHARTRAALAAE